jgi:asparagine synthase (glutamine-hydrolysing)
VVRDRLGIKPVYFAKTDKGTLFSSEIRAILSSGWVPKRVSTTGLHDYLRYQTVHAPATIVEGVFMLMPGHYIELDGNTEKVTCYWKAQDFATVTGPKKSRNEYLKEIRSTLCSSVELRMRADVPFGAFLSGGIDSSIVVGLMAEVATKPVKTFAITFHEKEWDESPYSDRIAKLFNTEHQSIRVSAQHFLDLIPEALEAMDHPSGDGPNTYVVSGATRKAGVKMAMSGLGGDELFAGYDVFKRMHRLEQQAWINAAPRALRGLAGNALMQLKPSIAAEKIRAILEQPSIDLAHAYPLSRQLFSEKKLEQWIGNGALSPNSVALLAERIARINAPLLSKVSILEIESYMQNVLLRDTDQMSMAHALEVRVPFLDHRLVELVLGIPDHIKYPHTPKQLLTDAVGNLIPREIIDRPKMGFSFPWGKWMKEDLKSLCEDNLKKLDEFGFFREGEMNLLWNAFLKNDPLVSWSRVWPLVVLGHWLTKNGFTK